MYPSSLLVLLTVIRASIDSLTGQLERKEITPQQWRDEMQKVLARGALAALMLGLGNEDLTDAQQQSISDYLNGQTEYLDDFTREIEAADGEWNGSWNLRAAMYGDSIQTNYWAGYLSRGGEFTWHYDPGAKHCADCAELNGQTHSAAWWIENFLPGDGRTQCLTGCRCWLTEA